MIRRIATVLAAVVIGTLTAAAPATAGPGTNIVPSGIIHCC